MVISNTKEVSIQAVNDTDTIVVRSEKRELFLIDKSAVSFDSFLFKVEENYLAEINSYYVFNLVIDYGIGENQEKRLLQIKLNKLNHRFTLLDTFNKWLKSKNNKKQNLFIIDCITFNIKILN